MFKSLLYLLLSIDCNKFLASLYLRKVCIPADMETNIINAAAGICAIREEFVIKREDKDDTTTIMTNKRKNDDELNSESDKKAKTNNGDGDRERKRGQNKARPATFKSDKSTKPCPSILNIKALDDLKPCQFPFCKFIHSSSDYLKSKPLDLGKTCHIFSLRGVCSSGIACRFGSSHITEDGLNIVDEDKLKNWKDDTKNALQVSLQRELQKRTYDFSLSEKVVKIHENKNKGSTKANGDKSPSEKTIGAITDEDIIKLLPKEKKSIDWNNKLYLAPLTTVGNLPFRRICKEFGADVTCGEMALCESILKGFRQEWALIKRHESEDLFGSQICGNNPYIIAKVCQALHENSELDFIDLNLGCPIDLVYKKGGGCGMMVRSSVLEASVKAASKLLSIPFTVKIRTGVHQDKKIAHTIVPKMAEWGASLITMHGRSREARYTRAADWEYIETCAKAAAPCPVFGNGDILSYEEYRQKREIAPSVKGVMIGRGALIKPWIFNEIKEQKVWDISSKERFEILKKYTNYGLEHFGSDNQGVENTRRFLLEWLSFLYRYVPVGLLERPPQKINERPPAYFGRDDLETLMASASCKDWIKISEMLLGPVPEGFNFLPKHKSNAY